MTRLIAQGRLSRGLPLAALGCGVLLACQERLAAPADCPNLCPGGYEVRDTVIDPEDNRDSSFEGYVVAGQGASLRVSYNFPPSEDRAVIRFIARPDSYQVKTDSTLPYTIDSVALSVTVVYRDTAVKNLYVYLYKLPSTLDSGYTFADAEAAFTPANLIDSLRIDDTLETQRVETILKGSDLGKVGLAPADSGKLAVGVGIRADSSTGIRLGNSGGAIPTFVTYINVFTGDTTSNHQLYTRVPSFSRFVSQTVPPLDLSVLTVGGAPSARSIIRFPWPADLRDSVQLIRVTLELVPTVPIPGLAGDTAFLQARPLLADLGSKSPAITDAFYVSFHPLVRGETDTLRLEVLRAATLWQGSQPLPSAFMLQLFPEGSSFTRATFGSSRTPGLRPRLRVSYARTFPFEAP